MTRYENEAKIAGIVKSIEEEYELSTETYYRVILEVPRLSENCDLLPFIMPSKMIQLNGIEEGMRLLITGSVRTKNVTSEDGHHKKVYGFASMAQVLSPEEYEAVEDKNNVRIEGAICMPPTFRTTTSGRLIADLVVAQSREAGVAKGQKKKIRSYYLPCIAWGNDAKLAQKLKVGDRIRLIGRFQSREYRRKADLLGDVRIAYEISILEYALSNEEKTVNTTAV